MTHEHEYFWAGHAVEVMKSIKQHNEKPYN
jgi:hypothetical protein